MPGDTCDCDIDRSQDTVKRPMILSLPHVKMIQFKVSEVRNLERDFSRLRKPCLHTTKSLTTYSGQLPYITIQDPSQWFTVNHLTVKACIPIELQGSCSTAILVCSVGGKKINKPKNKPLYLGDSFNSCSSNGFFLIDSLSKS